MQKQAIPPGERNRVLEMLPPYPIVLVTTRTNIITVNQIAYFTFTPLRIGVGIAHIRHTYSLLKEEGEFVVNIPDASLVEAVKVCGRVSGRDGDKFEAAGLDREESEQVRAPGIRQCGAQIECRVVQKMPFEERTWFIGEVVAARKAEGHAGMDALMCGRQEYMLPGAVVAPR